MQGKFNRRTALKTGLIGATSLAGIFAPLSTLAQEAPGSSRLDGRRIAKAEAFAVPMPFIKPFKQAKGVITHSDNVYVRLTDQEGRVGWGEGYNVPILYGRGYQEIYRALTDYLLPATLQHEPVEYIGLMDRLDKVLPDNRDAKCAIDMALFDLLGHQLEAPVSTLLGGALRSEIPMIAALPIDDPDRVASYAEKYVQQGYRHLKLKLGTPGNWQADVDRVLATRAAVGDEISIVADANAIYDRRIALQVLLGVQSARLDHFEQPINRYDIEGMAWLAAKCEVPIAADESLQTLQDAVKISQANAASSYVLKLIKQGGMYRARQLAHFCQAIGSPVHISGGTELSCGRAAMLHLFSTLPNGAGAVEVTEVMADDICHERLPFAPMVKVPEGTGLGVTVDSGLLERFTVESS